ncbi:MAG: endo alpha-1,4 polygalactosaminidase [Microbacteriaceae bacterium]
MTQHTRARGRRSLAGLLAIGIVTAVAIVGASPASAATATIAPSSIVSTKGSIASGQSVSNLAVKDQSGTTDTFSKYVEFDTISTGYAGYRQYAVPGSVAPSSVTGISVAANYRGPTQSQQSWTWSLYNWTTSSWTTLGNNSGASSWVWKSLTFASPTSASSYVSSTGAVRVQLSTTTGVDNALLDYEAITVTSGAPAGDTVAPSTPTSVASPGKSTTSVDLSWAASTDNVGVTGYEVFVNGSGTAIAASTTSATITGLTANTAYSFTVKAKDAAGNRSAASNALSVTTNAAVVTDTIAPSVPASLTSGATTATSVDLSWAASTDNVGVTGYEVFVNGSGTAIAASTTSATITGLTANTAYSFTVKAKDAAGNRSAASNALSVTTNAAANIAYTLPPANGKWDYQIGGPYTPTTGVQVVSRDRMVAPVPGLYNICYVNVMQTQPNESGQSTTNPPYGTTAWWLLNHPNVVLKNAAGVPIVDTQWNEVVFDVRTAAQRTELASVQKPWIQACKDAGYQAIEPDNIDAEVRSSGYLTHADVREYMKLLVPYAHSIGMAIGQKNAITSGSGANGAEWSTDGPSFVTVNGVTQGFDFAVAEECGAYAECAAFVNMYGGRVFVVEYTASGFTKGCNAWKNQLSVIQRNVDVRPSSASGYIYKEC